MTKQSKDDDMGWMDTMGAQNETMATLVERWRSHRTDAFLASAEGLTSSVEIPPPEVLQINVAEEVSVADSVETETDPTGKDFPNVVLEAIVQLGDKVPDGRIIVGVRVAWFEILDLLSRDPDALFKIPSRKLEEVIAAAYERDGYDEVVLTPGTRDKGRDVIAIKKGHHSVRILDQVKAYKKDRLVLAEDVRAMLGVITEDQNASKGLVTTSSDFAPEVWDEFRNHMPNRLELMNGTDLLGWLDELMRKKGC